MIALLLLKWMRNISHEMLLLLLLLLVPACCFLPLTGAAPSLTTEQLDMGVVSYYFFSSFFKIYSAYHDTMWSEVFPHAQQFLMQSHQSCLLDPLSLEPPLKSVVLFKYLLWILTPALQPNSHSSGNIHTAWLKIKTSTPKNQCIQRSGIKFPLINRYICFRDSLAFYFIQQTGGEKSLKTVRWTVHHGGRTEKDLHE